VPALTGVRASAFEIPTDLAEADGTLSWTSTVLVVVHAEAGGHTGLGYTYAHPGAVPLVTGTLTSTVEGRDALDVRGAWTAMVREVRNLGATGLAAMAISAVDAALWDLKARLLDVPLVVALDAVHETVPVYGSGGFTSYDDRQLADQLAGWVDSGIPRVKMKVGREPDRDRHRLTVARKAAGDDTELYIDANGAWSVRDAVEWAHVARGEFGVRWLEEPVTSDDLAGLRHVRERAPGGIDVAAGEYGWNPWLLQAMLDAQAVDCLQVDATRCLGLTGFLQAAALAEAHHLDVSAHCAPQQSVHACAAVRRLRHLEWFHDHTRIEAMAFDGALAVETGGVLRPDRGVAGNGLTLREPDLDRFRLS
jgi:L-alanine-DL-glutamate epimerase-like enolase superfamily enzyme